MSKSAQVDSKDSNELDIDKLLSDLWFAGYFAKQISDNIQADTAETKAKLHHYLKQREEKQRKEFGRALTIGIRSVDGDTVTIHATRELVTLLMGEQALDDRIKEHHYEQDYNI